MKKITLLSVMILMIVLTTHGQTATKADKRQNKQKERIQNGVQNAELTRQEARMPAKEQRHISKAEKCAEADGVVTRCEGQRWAGNRTGNTVMQHGSGKMPATGIDRLSAPRLVPGFMAGIDWL